MGQGPSYESRLQAEQQIYSRCVNVHSLPGIFHYWSDRYIRPKLEQFGFSSPHDLFKKYLEHICECDPHTSKTFISIGSGNGDLEIEVAVYLRDRGYTRFVIECLDLNHVMLARGREAGFAAGVLENLRFTQGDFNDWAPERTYDAVMANQSLHHVTNLEGLLSGIEQALTGKGLFLASDMIGRNGHQRWPESLKIVHEFWRKLPPSYRYNNSLKRYEELYENWDCSAEGFEGVRSQDILRLLLDLFHFQFFVGFGNVIDPFVDRVFGENFDAQAAWDRSFIDQVHHRDEEELAAGRLTPTHMVAVLGKKLDRMPVFVGSQRPEACVRMPTPSDASGAFDSEKNSYEWQVAEHDLRRELELACTRLTAANHQVKERTAWARKLEEEMEERTAWALRLNQEVKERTAWALRLEEEMKERTAWALRLDCEVKESALRELELQHEISSYVHNPFLFAARLLVGARRRTRRCLARWAVAPAALKRMLELEVDESASGRIGAKDLGRE